MASGGKFTSWPVFASSSMGFRKLPFRMVPESVRSALMRSIPAVRPDALPRADTSMWPGMRTSSCRTLMSREATPSMSTAASMPLYGGSWATVEVIGYGTSRRRSSLLMPAVRRSANGVSVISIVSPGAAIPIMPSTAMREEGVVTMKSLTCIFTESMSKSPAACRGTPQRSRAEMRRTGACTSVARLRNESTSISISEACMYSGSKACDGGVWPRRA